MLMWTPFKSFVSLGWRIQVSDHTIFRRNMLQYVSAAPVGHDAGLSMLSNLSCSTAGVETVFPFLRLLLEVHLVVAGPADASALAPETFAPGTLPPIFAVAAAASALASDGLFPSAAAAGPVPAQQ